MRVLEVGTTDSQLAAVSLLQRARSRHGFVLVLVLFEAAGRTPDTGALGQRLYRPHFDRAPRAQGRNALRDRNRLVEVVALDQVITAELLFGFGERPVG